MTSLQISMYVSLLLCISATHAQATSAITSAQEQSSLQTIAPRDEPLSVVPVVYPAEAIQARVEGTVKLQIKVDANGHVTAVDALSGPLLLRQAATEAYRRATYPPLVIDGHISPAIIATSVTFNLKELPPDTDLLVDRQFEPLHTQCQRLSLDRSPDALDACRQAVQMSERFTPRAQLEARATALNDLVLLLIAPGKASKQLSEAGSLADRAIFLVGSAGKNLPHTPAVAIAYITRAEVRSLAGNLKASAADCAEAEEVLTTLLADEKENERAGNYRVQLRDTLLLHAIVMQRDDRSRDAQRLRERAGLL